VPTEVPDRKRLGSLDLILDETRSERQAQVKHFEGLDAKAGILLGFSGALVALAPSDNAVVAVGRITSVLAGLGSLWAFWPRKLGVLNVYVLRQKYISSDPRFTKLSLLDTQIAMLRSAASLLHRKSIRLKWAMALLVVAVILVGVGLGLD
jgi:hypothetical protein